MATSTSGTEGNRATSSSEAGPSNWSPLSMFRKSRKEEGDGDGDGQASQWTARGMQEVRQRAYRVQRKARESLARHSPSIGPEEVSAGSTSLAMDSAQQGLRLQRRLLATVQDVDDNEGAEESEEKDSRGIGSGLASLQDLKKKGEEIVAGNDRQEEEEEESAVSAAFLISYFLAGGAAGATSRTVVSPLERLKIIM